MEPNEWVDGDVLIKLYELYKNQHCYGDFDLIRPDRSYRVVYRPSSRRYEMFAPDTVYIPSDGYRHYIFNVKAHPPVFRLASIRDVPHFRSSTGEVKPMDPSQPGVYVVPEIFAHEFDNFLNKIGYFLVCNIVTEKYPTMYRYIEDLFARRTVIPELSKAYGALAETEYASLPPELKMEVLRYIEQLTPHRGGRSIVPLPWK
jgi:hypothetical protein